MALTSTLNNEKCTIAAQVNVQNGNVQIGNINMHLSDLEAKINEDDFNLPRLIDTFHGREQEFNILNQLLFSKNKLKVVIHGLPGYGKTELSKQYAQQCLKKKKMQRIFWIKAENESELHKIAPTLKKIYKKYENVRCMFIFDNALNRRSICDYEPSPSNKHKMLITSHVADWGHGVAPLPIKPLTSEPVKKIFKTLLETNYREEESELYVKLAQIVDYVPLGIQIVGGYVRQRIHSLGQSFRLIDCVEEMKQSKQKIINDTFSKDNPNPYTNSIYGALTASLNKIIEEDLENRELAIIVLYACAFLDPELILIQHLTEIPAISQQIATKNGEVELKSAIGLLINFSFVSYSRSDEVYIKMHRLIQSYLRQHLSLCKLEEKYYSACVYSMLCLHNCSTRSVLDHVMDPNTVQECFKFLETVFEVSNARKWILEYDLLFYAAHKDQIEILELLLQHVDTNIHTINDEYKKCYILCTIVKNSKLELLNSLLKQSVNIHIKCSMNYTVLHVAAITCNTEAIKLLLTYGADVNAESYRHETSTFEFVRYLGTTVNRNIDKQQQRAILDLLHREEHSQNTNIWGGSLLHVAAEKTQADVVELLIQLYGYDVNKQNDEGNTPLHEVARWLYKDSNKKQVVRTVRMLIQCGASLNIENCKRQTPLQVLRLHIKQWGYGEYLIEHLTPTKQSADEKTLVVKPTQNNKHSCDVI